MHKPAIIVAAIIALSILTNPVYAVEVSVSSGADGSITVSGDAALTVDGETEETAEEIRNDIIDDQTRKLELYDKYSDLIANLEAGRYQEAIDIIDGMRPEMKEGKTELTLDNWEDYFLIEQEYSYEYDAYGNVTSENIFTVISLRPEYRGKAYAEGTIGYVYNCKTYRVVSFGEEEGTLDYVEEDVPARIRDADYFKTLIEPQSKSDDLSEKIVLESARGISIIDESRTSMLFGGIQREDYENGYPMYIVMPDDIQVVRIEGTLTVEHD